MEVTEVRVKLAGNRDDKLRAFCTVTFENCFVVRDVKIIRGTRGVFVAMPSRKLSDLCPKCRGKNHLRAHYCNECGHQLVQGRATRDEKGRTKLHADVAHPIHREFRNYLQTAIIAAYEAELERASQPGYQPPSDDYLDALDDDYDETEGTVAEQPAMPPPPPSDDQQDRRFGEGILP